MKFILWVAWISLGTFLSRLFGILRDITIANKLGISPINDAYITAFRLSNILRNIFSEGALSIVFIPEFSRLLNESNKRRAFIFASQVHLLLIYFLGLLTIIVLIFMSNIIYLITPGFRENIELFQTIIIFARIIFPYLFFISLTAFYGGILNSINQFFPFAFAPTILNISVIIGLSFFDFFPTMGHTLSAFTLIGGMLEVLWMRFFLLKYECNLYWCKSIFNKQIKQFLIKMCPIILSSSISHFNIYISITVLSFFYGGMSYMYYAERIIQLPITLVSVIITTLLLPLLGQKKNINVLLEDSVKFLIILTIPSMLGMIIVSDDIVQLLFAQGKFTTYDIKITTEILNILSFGIIPCVIAKLLQTNLYAQSNTLTPSIISIICSLINIISSIALSQYFHCKGLVIANATYNWIHFILLLGTLKMGMRFYIFQIIILESIISILPSLIMYFSLLLWDCIFRGYNIYLNILLKITTGVLIYSTGYLLISIKRSRIG